MVKGLQENMDVLKHLDDYERIRERLRIRMLNPERNSERLRNLAVLPFLDLAVTFAVMVSEMEHHCALIRVTSELFSSWNVTAEQVLKDALENERRDGAYRLDNILDVVKKLYDENSGLSGQMPDDSLMKGERMYVISEKSSCNGSAAILMNDLLQGFSEVFEGDFLILPSSVNELICVRDHSELDYNYIRSVVEQVNDAAVPDDEILSYSVYRYSRCHDSVSIVA